MAQDYHFSEIEPLRHLRLGEGQTTADNVKAKIVIPLLVSAGWDPIEDLFFAAEGVDITVTDGGKEPLLVVQVLDWSEPLTADAHLWCVEELAHTGASWAVLSSGRTTKVISSLAVFEAAGGSRDEATPLAEFAFDVLEPRRHEISRLIGKEACLGGFDELRRLTLDAECIETWEEYEVESQQSLTRYREREEGSLDGYC